MPEKNALKCKIIDQLLMGKDVLVEPRNAWQGRMYVHGANKLETKILFEWHDSAPIRDTSITLKEALRLIDEHWDRRITKVLR